MVVINHQRSTTTFSFCIGVQCNRRRATVTLILTTRRPSSSSHHHTSPRAVTRRQVIIGDHDGSMSVLDYLNGASMKQFSYIE